MTCKSTRSFSLPLRFAITSVVEEKKKGISNQATCSTSSLIHGDAGSTADKVSTCQCLWIVG
jgi:hypothetical protein